MDLTALRLEVTAVLGLTNTSAGDQPLVDTWINEGVTDIVMRSACRVQPATMALTVDTVDYNLPTAILRIVDVYTAADSTGYTMTEVSPSELFNMRRLNSAASSVASRYYAVAGGNLLMIHLGEVAHACPRLTPSTGCAPATRSSSRSSTARS